MAVITRPELIKLVSQKINRQVTQEDIYWVLQGFAQCLPDILANGDTLKIGDCFTMEPKLKKKRKVGNFGKGEMIIPAHYVPCFRPYKKLKDVCANLPVENKKI